MLFRVMCCDFLSEVQDNQQPEQGRKKSRRTRRQSLCRHELCNVAHAVGNRASCPVNVLCSAIRSLKEVLCSDGYLLTTVPPMCMGGYNDEVIRIFTRTNCAWAMLQGEGNCSSGADKSTNCSWTYRITLSFCTWSLSATSAYLWGRSPSRDVGRRSLALIENLRDYGS